MYILRTRSYLLVPIKSRINQERKEYHFRGEVLSLLFLFLNHQLSFISFLNLLLSILFF